MTVDACPCGSGVAYAACCEPCLLGALSPPTAERLMRSRYTAYVLRDQNYLLQTWHPRTRPQSLDLTQAVKWVDLTVLRTEAGGPADSEAVVEFVARFKDNGRMCRLHEASRFIKEGDRWYYVAGT